MKTRDLRDEQGLLTGFSVSNLFFSRHAVARVVASIPGVEIVRKQKRIAFSARDDFCEFIVDGKTFLAIEPFGDNSDFWVVPESIPEGRSQIAKVRFAFEQHRLFRARV
jgi:hypothetical protein